MPDAIEQAILNSIGDESNVPEPLPGEVEAQAEGEETPAEETPAEGEEETPAEETPAEGEEEPVETVDTRTDEEKEIDALLDELGLKAPAPGKKENRIPYTRVRKIGGSLVRKAIEKFTTTPRFQAANQSLRQFDAMNRVFMGQDTDAFIKSLAAVDKRYEKYLQPAAPAKEDLSDMPKPDVDLGNGSMTYSEEQHAKRVAWEVSRAMKAERKSMDAAYEQKFGKLLTNEEQREALEQRGTAITGLLDDASKWPGFVAHADAINAKMQEIGAKYPNLTDEQVINRAYREVVVPKLSSDKDHVRKELLAEQKKAPLVASARPQGKSAVQTPSPSGDPITDAITRSIAKLPGR